MASSVRFLDTLEQTRGRFVPDTSEDESCSEDAPLRARVTTAKRSSAVSTGTPPRRDTLQRRKLHKEELSTTPEQLQSTPAVSCTSTATTADSRYSRSSRPVLSRNTSAPKLVDTGAVTPSYGLKSFGSWSSISSSSQSFRLAKRSMATSTAAFEQDLLTSSVYSSSSHMNDALLVAQARDAKKLLEAAAKRQVMVGKWKPLVRSKPDCQVLHSMSRAKDQYSVVAKLNLPCSLREIMSVFATDNVKEFHRSMEALFGDQYVYGVNMRSVDCAPFLASGFMNRRNSHPTRRPSFPANPHLRTAKLSLNAVSLMQKQQLVWKQRNMAFVDYQEEKLDDKSVVRVLQTMDDDGSDDEDDDPTSVSVSTSTAGSSSRHTAQQYHRIPDRRDRAQRELHGILAGYIMQEDSEEKFTRLFFYANYRRDQFVRRLSTSAVQLLRAMALKTCLLEAVVMRRRLGYYPLVPEPSEVPTSQVAYCSACYIPFSMLRKKYFCRLCGHYTCWRCSSVQAVEKVVGSVERYRVCAACVRRVSYCVFSTGALPPKTFTSSSGSSAIGSTGPVASLSEIPEDDTTPILDDLAATAIEDIAMLNPGESGRIREYMKSLLSSRKSREEDEVVRLSGSDIDTWMENVEGDATTPPEEISVLDSTRTSVTSSGSHPWYPSSPVPR